MSWFETKLSNYRRRLVHEWNMYSDRRSQSKANTAVKHWIDNLSLDDTVLLGPNYAEFGGVRGHLQAIVRYSSLSVTLVPSEKLLKQIGIFAFQQRLMTMFLKVDASRCRAIHSHVFPDFIDWCHLQQQENKAFWVHTYHLNYFPEHTDGTVNPQHEAINRGLIDVARHADVRLSVAKWQTKYLAENFGIESRYLPNGVDVENCLKGNARRFKRRFQIENFVLFVGRDDPVKNPREFVELARRLEGIPCVMIGSGLDKAWSSTCPRPFPKNIHLLGSQDKIGVQDALAAADVVVVTSKREGLPTLVLEAMVHESPLVVPNEPGSLEAVNQGEFAKIYELGNLIDLECKVRLQLEERLGCAHARRRILQQYDWEKSIIALDKTYSRDLR